MYLKARLALVIHTSKVIHKKEKIEKKRKESCLYIAPSLWVNTGKRNFAQWATLIYIKWFEFCYLQSFRTSRVNIPILHSTFFFFFLYWIYLFFPCRRRSPFITPICLSSPLSFISEESENSISCCGCDVPRHSIQFISLTAAATAHGRGELDVPPKQTAQQQGSLTPLKRVRPHDGSMWRSHPWLHWKMSISLSRPDRRSLGLMCQCGGWGWGWHLHKVSGTRSLARHHSAPTAKPLPFKSPN